MTVYFQPLDIEGKSTGQLLAADGTVNQAWMNGWDPYWLMQNENSTAVATVSASGQPPKGYDINGVHISNKMLCPGSPNIDISPWCGMQAPDDSEHRAKTSGNIGRATGVMLDKQGRVGMFINGFDTPSDIDPGNRIRPYGPDIHIGKSGLSGAIYLGPGSEQCLHMACRVHLGMLYFDPPAINDATGQVGTGGQIGWRISFRRYDNGVFRPSSDTREISVLCGFWDSREGGDGHDSVGNVTAGEYWIGAPLTSNQSSRFVTNYGAAEMHGRQQHRDAEFYWNITRQNMLNILEAIGASGTTPEDIRVSGCSFNCELFDNRPQNELGKFKPGQFGFNFSNMIVDIW